MTELKNVLHLYTGQECKCYYDIDKKELECTGTILSVDALWEKGLRHPFPVRVLTKRGKGTNTYESESFFHWDCIAPLLRPLNSMTKDESEKYHSLNKFYPASPVHQIMVEHATFESFTWLLKNGFDCFELIDNGQAEIK